MTSRVNDDYAVSTGSGSDRVSIHTTVESVWTITRSLPLPVLTSSLHPISYAAERLIHPRQIKTLLTAELASESKLV
jgi:hypothetical protein